MTGDDMTDDDLEWDPERMETYADRIQAMQAQLDAVRQQQQAVPSILDWGMGQ